MSTIQIRKRPLLVSIVLWIGFIATIGQFGMMMMPTIRKIGLFAPAIYGLFVTVTFIALIGIWYMKRWGLELLLYVVFAKTVYLFLIDSFSGAGLFLMLLIIGSTLPFYRRMDKNL